MPLMLFIFPIERWWGIDPVFFCSFIVWLYITYFLYKYYVIPRLTASRMKRYFALVAVLVSVAVNFWFSTYRIVPPVRIPPHIGNEIMQAYPVWGLNPTKQAIWLHFLYVVTFSFVTGLLSEIYRQRISSEAMENERNRAELQMYKAQINPHFLFNTLNTIYGLLITRSEKTIETFERFVSLSKYTYKNANLEYVSVSEEVEYIEQYIELQSLRLNEHASVKFTHSEQNEKYMLPAMLLITFVENAFKYGISSDEDCFININLQQMEGIFYFVVENSVFKRKDDNSQGVGLKNCRKRLDMMYGNRYTLETGENDKKVFTVKLKILPTKK
jgi:LytS/YehU family sensor histidine kinase